MWYFGYKTELTKELDFCWATDNLEKYYKVPILHMAGVTEEQKNEKFFKGGYIKTNPINLLKEQPDYFDFIEKQSSTTMYINELKELAQK
jgi:hypothetical protein